MGSTAEKKRIIGIDFAAEDKVIGSVILSIVAIDDITFFRKYNIPKTELTPTERSELIDKIKNKVWFDTLRIQPDKDSNYPDLKARGVVEALNLYPQFWKNNIRIFTEDDSLVERLTGMMPHNLKIKNLRMKKWVTGSRNAKILNLAKVFAEWAHDMEYAEIRMAWENFGSGDPTDEETIKFMKDNDDCPYIRKLMPPSKC